MGSNHLINTGWLLSLLKRLHAPDMREGYAGDIEEVYAHLHQTKGHRPAQRWLWIQLVQSMPNMLWYTITGSLIMFKATLQVAFRHMKKQLGYTFINILGLALGLASCLFIAQYVSFERSYDNYHTHAGRIYRINHHMQNFHKDTGVLVDESDAAQVHAPLIPEILQNFPQVEAGLRVYEGKEPLVRRGAVKFREKAYRYVDASIFDIFSIPFIEGDAASALQEPGSIVISQRLAEKYFGAQSALGGKLLINEQPFKITGITANAPANTHLKTDLLISFKTFEARYDVTRWGWFGFRGYIKLSDDADASRLEKQITETYGGVMKDYGMQFQFFLEPVKAIHLNTRWTGETHPRNLMILTLIALFILSIACVNYVNLVMARAALRTREIGLRKSIGAFRGQIIRQFLSEAVLTGLLAFIFTLLLVALALPVFNSMTERTLALTAILQPVWLLRLFAVALGVSLLAGFYPALYLSKFKPVAALKGALSREVHGAKLRRILICGQFVISVLLIISTLIIHDQFRFMRDKDLGFAPSQRVVVPIPKEVDYESLKHELLQHPSITAATASFRAPGKGTDWNGVCLANTENNHEQVMQHQYVDADFLDTYELALLAGRFFERGHRSDVMGSIVINETAMEALGWQHAQDAVGHAMESFLRGHGEEADGRIIGVVKDFHYEGVQDEIRPLVMIVAPHKFESLTLKLTTSDLSETLDFIKQRWETRFPDDVYELFFLDEVFTDKYRAEQRLSYIFTTFSTMAIVISCLGLLGLATYMGQRRAKELGIRKICGASRMQLFAVLSRPFGLWVVTANVLAWPVAYIALQKWLETFAFRIPLRLSPFMLAAAASLLIALLSVSFHSIKAATSNPTEALKNE